MSRCDKDFDQPGIFRGFKGLLHVPPGLRIGGRQSDPENGLSQNWIFRPERANAGSRDGQRRGLGLAHHLESSSIARQKLLCV
jgi:hypothetical protein